MHIRPASVAMLLILSSFMARAVYADSDGYYCVGRGYIAYQFGFAAPPVGPHNLYVVRFGGASGIEGPSVLALPQFQVHGIVCGERDIQIAAYDAIYTVRLDSTGRPVSYDSVPWTDHPNMPPQFIARSLNLGEWSLPARYLKEQRELLATASDGGRYVLEITAAPVAANQCLSMVTSRIVRTDRNGHEIQHVDVFRGRGVRECGD